MAMFDDDEDDDELFDSKFNEELERYEEMVRNKESYYFDAEILEQIIDHFIVKNQVKSSLLAIDFAKSQHPQNMVFDLRKAQIYSTTGNLKESLLILQALEKADPFNAEIYITKASVFSQLRDHDRAIKYFTKAIEVSSDFDDAEVDDIRFDLAMEYESIHDYQNAIKILSVILEHSPNNEAAIYEIAYCFERIGNFDQCIEFYNKYIDNNPYSFTAWYNLGNIYFLKNNLEKALWAYDYAIIINEDFSSAYFNLGNTYMQMAQYEKAIEAYRKCIDIDGDEALTLSYLGEAFERLEKYDLAIFYYEKSKELNEELPEPWIGLGIIKEVQGFGNEAVSFIQHAINLQPDNANYHLVLAECLYKLNRIEESETSLLEAINLDNFYPEAILLLSGIYEDRDIQLALKFNEDLADMNRQDIKVQLNFVAVLYKSGNKTEAFHLFDKIAKSDVNSAKNLILYLPKAFDIDNFKNIIDTYHD